MMNVFVLCTGRNGSVSFYHACRHIENYTAAHEGHAKKFGSDRFDFPNNHIEIDNRLSWDLGRLDKHYGDNALYVHLKREDEKVAKSFSRRYFTPLSIMDAYTSGIHLSPPYLMTSEQREAACLDYVQCINENIELFLKDKTQVVKIEIENIELEFPIFWKKIGAKGNYSKALAEFSSSHNSSGRIKYKPLIRLKHIIKKERLYYQKIKSSKKTSPNH